MTKRITLSLLFGALTALCIFGRSETPADTARVNYIPKISGALRAGWEIETDDGLQHFQVKNARVWLNGNVARPMDYSLLMDFCESGKVKVVDLWMRFKSAKHGWTAQLGQFRMPFGLDSHRGPGNYYFTNRSFLGKQVCNQRSVGLMATWQLPWAPLDLRAGVFNTTPLSDHTKWHHGVAWSVKALLKTGPWTATAGYISVNPDGLRSNMTGCAVNWHEGRWTAEAEYIYEHYARSIHNATHAWNFMADYAIPVRLTWFNLWSWQVRYDGMTSHVDLKNYASNGGVPVIDPARNRLTLGTTLAWVKTPLKAELRLNYEQYFYHHGEEIPAGEQSKFVAECIFTF